MGAPIHFPASLGEELSGGIRKARKILFPKVGSNAGKSDLSQVSRKAGNGGPGRVGPSQIEEIRGLRSLLGPQQPPNKVNQGEDPPWTKVERKRKKEKPEDEEVRSAKPRRCKRVAAKREGSDALVIKTEQSK